MDTVYVAVWKDRHTDDTLAAFHTSEGADEWIDSKKKWYDENYVFSDGSTYNWIDNRDPKPEDPEELKWYGYVWENRDQRYVTAESDDGPSGQVHKLMLD